MKKLLLKIYTFPWEETICWQMITCLNCGAPVYIRQAWTEIGGDMRIGMCEAPDCRAIHGSAIGDNDFLTAIMGILYTHDNIPIWMDPPPVPSALIKNNEDGKQRTANYLAKKSAKK